MDANHRPDIYSYWINGPLSGKKIIMSDKKTFEMSVSIKDLQKVDRGKKIVKDRTIREEPIATDACVDILNEASDRWGLPRIHEIVGRSSTLHPEANELVMVMIEIITAVGNRCAAAEETKSRYRR